MMWTDLEIEWLKLNYPLIGKKESAKFLNKSESSIRMKTSRLGLKQDKQSKFFFDWQSRAASSKVGKKRPEQAEIILKLHRQGRLKMTEEGKEKTGNRTREMIAKKGHPKGMLGKKHSEDTLKIISNATIKMWNNPESILNQSSHRQKLSDRMSLSQNQGILRNGYSRGKQGRREDLDNIFFRSSWEANYARYLNFLKLKGLIYKWEFEPDTFWFEKIKRGVRSYLPDFKIWDSPLSMPYYVEVKGWMDDKSKTKLKRMNKYYPEIRVDVVARKEYNEIKKKISSMIPSWE